MGRLRSYTLPFLLLASFGIAFYPPLAQLFQKWSASDYYIHAFFTVPLIGYMIWRKRAMLAENSGRPFAGLAFIALSILFYLLSLQLQIPTFIFLSMNVTIISCLIYVSGFRILKELAIPLLLLFMLIPIPNQLLSTITASLQLRVSEIIELIFQIFSIEVLREGYVLHLPTRSFEIVEACSGLRTLISLATLSLIIGYFTLANVSSILLLFLFSLPIAIFINIIRILTLILICCYVQYKSCFGQLSHYHWFCIFCFRPHIVICIPTVSGIMGNKKEKQIIVLISILLITSIFVYRWPESINISKLPSLREYIGSIDVYSFVRISKT